MATVPGTSFAYCGGVSFNRKNRLLELDGNVTGEHPGTFVQTAGLTLGVACKMPFACQDTETVVGEGLAIASVFGTSAKDKALENVLLPAEMSFFTVSCTTSFAPVAGIASAQMLKRKLLVAGSRSCGPLSV